MKIALFWIMAFVTPYSIAQYSITGSIIADKGTHIDVELNDFPIQHPRDGRYEFKNVAAGTYRLTITATGYQIITDSITILDRDVNRDYQLVKDALQLQEIVVTGTRRAVPRHKTPVIVNTISSRTFEATQSLSIAEGLSFSPGLRVENNCQNCGFTQLRMNGLDGPYSQILINNRPIFSALAGVYGLEMLPATMVEKIEVVRGGGSVLYGGNAIAGTVNIITKDPIRNSFEAGVNQSFTNMDASDRSINFNGAIVADDLNAGATIFGFNRERQPWDANADSFSELVSMTNTTFGFDGYWNISPRHKFKLGAFHIREFRRGGNKFELPPHQADIAEQLHHDILSLTSSFEYLSENLKHKISVYGAFQSVDRDSYYGAGGRILQEGDTLTPEDILALNAYGTSTDKAATAGIQYNYTINESIALITGTELTHNSVLDQMPGYQRSIDQDVSTIGTYAQLELRPLKRLTLLAGGRFDHLSIRGFYNLAEDQLVNRRDLSIFVPRFSAMYEMHKNLKFRASFAQGYRGPQAFDEDLHIETVGGAAKFIALDPNLTTERSNSILFSINYDKSTTWSQVNFVLEGFHTALQNPFLLSDQQELPSGVAVITKRNGSGAQVYGINVEANMAFHQKWILQSGGTLQKGLYDTPETIWESPTSGELSTRTSDLLRTPQLYGYFSILFNPNRDWSFSWSAVATGSMKVPHVIDPDTERTVIKSTPSFFENNFKIARTIRYKDYNLQLFTGVQNIFNQFQNDFDSGITRDAGYVYGPLRPRTFFAGLKIGIN